MKSIITKGSIYVKGPLNFEYRICDITHIVFEDESFEYRFEPNYSVMELVDAKYFQGIPGLNLDLKKPVYIRKNIVPVFISERVPNRKREDYFELLLEAGLTQMNPIQYLINTKFFYSGDEYYLKKYVPIAEVNINDCINPNMNNNNVIKLILNNIANGNNVSLQNLYIDDSNRKMIHDLLMFFITRAFGIYKKKRLEGIYEAKENKKYKGRIPIQVDTFKFMEYENKVINKEITVLEASKQLGISKDKYYRLRKSLFLD